MKCASCEAILRDGAPFCETCGAPIQGRVVAPPAAETTEAPVHQVDDESATVALPLPQSEGLPATVGVRVAAAGIDVVAPVAVASLFVVAAVVTGVGGLAWVVAPLVLLSLGLWNTAFASLTGASYGRVAMGTRVVVNGPDGPAPGFPRIWVRSLIMGLTCGVAGLTVLADARRRGWHDRVAGVEVIDILNGPSPFGERPASPVLRRARRGLVDLSSPIERPSAVVDVSVAS